MPVGESRPMLTAKMVAPELSRMTITRSRLHDQLSHQAGVRLTTVVAPAGWGKTTLLAAGW